MKKKIITLLVVILTCTGCETASNIANSKEHKEDITNEIAGSETNDSNKNSEVENMVDSRALDTQPIYEITNGNTGKRMTLNESQQLECMDALLKNMKIQKEESIKSDAEKTVGYLYCIRALNENGEVSKTITLNRSHVIIDDKYFIVESTENLVAYLDELYK